MHHISRFVTDAACGQLAELQRQATNCPVAINVLPCQLVDTAMVERITELARHHGIDTSLLVLALLENEDATKLPSCGVFAKPLRDLSGKFALGDFGTGHSSLAILSSMKIDTVILKSFHHLPDGGRRNLRDHS